MLSPHTPPGNPANNVDPRAVALERLREGTNPFATQATTVGTADESLQSTVPEFIANQLADLIAITELYRAGRPATRVFPMLGDRGAGKTHLLYTLRCRLRKQAEEAGDETLVIVVDRLSAGMDPIDYLLWQIVNFLLTRKTTGERLLGVIAERLTSRLLAEALRHLAPPQRIELIPASGWWDGLRLRMGSTSRIQHRLDAIELVIQACERKNPAPNELQKSCGQAGLPLATALNLIERHLDRTESSDVQGWLRRQLYARLVKLALLGDREPFAELHAGDYEGAPANVAKAGIVGRRLLDVWLELLTSLKIPVVVVFDQLEDYLRGRTPEQESFNYASFTSALSLFINELKHVCILAFAERALWSDLMNRSDSYTTERLRQPIPLPGRPAHPYLSMPDSVPTEILTLLIQQRIRSGFPDLDLTGLPSTFPFENHDLQGPHLATETSIRDCLRRLARRYDEIVHPVQPKVDVRQKLFELWREQVAVAAQTYGTEMVFRVTFIPEIQNALHGWLEVLDRSGLTGSLQWSKIELLNDPKKQPYGNLSVIRTEGRDAPGIGIAAWLGTRRAQSVDLRQRLGFFEMNPCPIRTLIMLRADGENALVGETKSVYEKAIQANRDIRIHQYQPKHLHSLMAFTPWYQAALAALEAMKESETEAESIFRSYLAKLSEEILGWIEAWHGPVSAPDEAKK